jgi:hypothetical protein
MIKIQSPDHLLSHLARKGDPSAFYTLVAPCAHALYVSMRNSGKSHKEVMAQIVPFLKKLYRSFSKKPGDVDFNSWYTDKQKKHLEAIPDAAMNTSGEELFIEHISAPDLSHFDSQIKLLFLRNYSKVRTQKKKSLFKNWADSLRTNALLRWAGLFLLFLAACVAVHVYITVAQIKVTLSIASKSFQHTVVLPSMINNRIIRHNPAPLEPLQTANGTPDTLHPVTFSSINPADTLHKPVALKKRVVSTSLAQQEHPFIPLKKTSSAGSPLKTGQDSLLTTLKAPDEHHSQILSQQPVKTSPMIDKTSPLPSPQKRRPPSLSDSSMGSP